MRAMKTMLRESKVSPISLALQGDTWPKNSDSKNRVVYIHKNTERLFNSLIERYQDDDVYCIENAYSSDMPEYSVKISDDNKVEIKNKSDLQLFLERAEQDKSGKIYHLLINWSDLSPRTRLSLNTVIDDSDRSIQGLRLPDNVQVEGVIKQLGNDRSFISRHDHCYRVRSLPQTFKLKRNQDHDESDIKVTCLCMLIGSKLFLAASVYMVTRFIGTKVR